MPTVTVDYDITQHDFGKVMKVTLFDADGNTVDLGAATSIKLYLGDPRTAVLIIDGGDLVADANQNPPDADPPGNRGVAYYTWTADDTATHGLFEGIVKARWGASQQLTHPTDPRIRVLIKKDLVQP